MNARGTEADKRSGTGGGVDAVVPFVFGGLLLVALGVAAAPAAPPPLPLLFSRTFDRSAPGVAGPGWRLLSGRWRIEGATNRALRQVQQPLFQEAFALAAWTNPTIRCRFQVKPGPGQWGVGVAAQCVQPDRYYLAALIGGKLHLLKRKSGWVTSLAETNADCPPGQWQWLQLSVTNEQGKLALTGSCRLDEQTQRVEVKAIDETDPFLRGTVGVWCANVDLAVARFEVRETTSRSARPLLSETFDRAETGALPECWEAAKGRWFADRLAGQGVLRHPRQGQDVSFDQNALALLRLRDYTVNCRVRRDTKTRVWGAGVVAYCRGAEAHYRLRALGGMLYLTKRSDAEHARNLAETKLPVAPGTWYTFKLRLRTLSDGVQLLGRVWTGGHEPGDWTLTAFDAVQPLPGGAAGLWAFGGATSFDDFQVVDDSVDR